MSEVMVKLVTGLSKMIAKEMKSQKENNSKEVKHNKLLNKTELAKKLGYHTSEINDIIYSTGFPKMKIKAGGQLRFSEFAVDMWIDDNQVYDL